MQTLLANTVFSGNVFVNLFRHYILIEGIKIFCFPSCLVNLSMTLFVRLVFLFHIIKDHNSSFRMCPSADLFFTELQFNLNLVTHEFLCNSFQMLFSAPGIRSTHGSSSGTNALSEFKNNFTSSFFHHYEFSVVFLDMLACV